MTLSGSMTNCPLLRRIGAADQRHGEALRMARIIEPIASLDAQARVIGGTVASLDVENAVVLDVIGELTAHAAIGAQRIDRFVGYRAARPRAPASARRSGQACTHSPHPTQVEAPIGSSMSNTIFACWPREARPMTSFICSSRQARTQRVHWMQASRLTAMAACDRSGCTAGRGAKRGLPTFSLRRPFIDLVVAGVFLLRHVGLQQLDHHLLRLAHAFVVGGDLHAVGRRRGSRTRREHPLAFDLNHAGAAIADRLHALLVAEPRNFDALAIGDLDQGFVWQRRDFAAVQHEGHGGCFGLRRASGE